MMTFNERLKSLLTNYLAKDCHGSFSAFCDEYKAFYKEVLGKDAQSNNTLKKYLFADEPSYTEEQVKVLAKIFHDDTLLKDYYDSLVDTNREKGISAGKATFDTGRQFGNVLRTDIETDCLSPDSLWAIIDMFLADTIDLPLLIMGDQNSYVKFLLANHDVDRRQITGDVTEKDILDSPNNVVLLSYALSPMSTQAGSIINTVTKAMKEARSLERPKRCVIAFETTDDKDVRKALEVYGKHHYAAQYHMNKSYWNKWFDSFDNAPALSMELERFVNTKIEERKRHNIPDDKYIYLLSVANWNQALKAIGRLRKICVESDGLSKTDLAEKLLAHDDVWSHSFAHHLMERERTDDTEAKEMAKRAEEYRVAIDDSLREKYPDACAIIDGMESLPKGFAECDKAAYLYALQEVTKILNHAPFWIPEFKTEVECWLKKGDVSRCPDITRDGWVKRLTRLHKEHREFLQFVGDASLFPSYHYSWQKLLTEGFPVGWFTNGCDHLSYLEGISQYDEWRKTISDVLAAQGFSPDDETAQRAIKGVDYEVKKWRASGDVPSLDAEGWQEWFCDKYMEHSVPPDFDKMIKGKQEK